MKYELRFYKPHSLLPKPKAKITLGVVLCISSMLITKASFAACGSYGPLNESYKEDPAQIIADIRQGCSPPIAWTKGANGSYSGLSGFTANSLNGHFIKSSRPAGGPLRFYKNKACNTYLDTRAGGFNDNGADNPCQLGNGTGLFDVDFGTAAPAATTEAVNCLGNLAGAIGGLLSGGGASNLGGVQASASASGNCVSGSIGICGLGSIGGSICNNAIGAVNNAATAIGTNNGQPFSLDAVPKYVEATGITTFDYANTPLNQTTAVYFPQGGVLTYGGQSYNIQAGGFITMNQQGTVFIGTSGGSTYTSPPGGFALAPNQLVSVTPTGGVAQLDSTLLRGNTIGTPVDLITVGTNQATNVATGSVAQINTSAQATAGATLIPDPSLNINTPVVAGSFAPGGVITPDPAPAVNSIPAVAAAESTIQ